MDSSLTLLNVHLEIVLDGEAPYYLEVIGVETFVWGEPTPWNAPGSAFLCSNSSVGSPKHHISPKILFLFLPPFPQELDHPSAFIIYPFGSSIFFLSYFKLKGSVIGFGSYGYKKKDILMFIASVEIDLLSYNSRSFLIPGSWEQWGRARVASKLARHQLLQNFTTRIIEFKTKRFIDMPKTKLRLRKAILSCIRINKVLSSWLRPNFI